MAVGIGEQKRHDRAVGRTCEQAFLVALVIPTRNEADAVPDLFDRLTPVLDGLRAEVLFVDDSDDDTPDRLAQLGSASASDFEVRVLHRDAADRAGGLGTAVVQGMREARARWICVMDADLQHPPETIRELLSRSRQGDADVVVASRYCADGASDLSSGRHVVSRLSTRVARAAFPKRLRGVSDPMSGFFVVDREAVPVDALRPNGFKILLEIVVRSPRLRVVEVPFRLAQRQAGHSKGSLGEGARFAAHVLRLRAETLRRRGMRVATP